jgi:hypothetical protein
MSKSIFWGEYLARGPGKRSIQVHDVCGRHDLIPMPGKPIECLETEKSLKYRMGDVCIVTFPKTGTTLIQHMCHLIRTKCADIEFDDIHQVCPHTSSAWYIGQDLNAEQVASPRLFKSHRELSQVAPYATGVKFISTIRDPTSTLLSLISFNKIREVEQQNVDVLQYATSYKWTCAHNEGSIRTVFDHYATFWKCLNCDNFLLLPYEDVVAERNRWIPIIASFLNIVLSDEMVEKVAHLTSKESMIAQTSKFNESWCKAERERLGRPHHSINQVASKVTLNNYDALLIHTNGEDIRQKVAEINQKLWEEKVMSVTGIRNYEEMRKILYQKYFPS